MQQNSVTKSETSELPTLPCLQRRLPGTSFQAKSLMKSSWTPYCKQSRVHHAMWANFPSCSQQKQEGLLLYSVPAVKAEAIPGTTLKSQTPAGPGYTGFTYPNLEAQ